jgi:hypothetical protein
MPSQHWTLRLPYKFLRPQQLKRPWSTATWQRASKISRDYSCGGWGNVLPAGKDKGKHCKSKSSPGCVIILNEETAAEQQPHRALSASATKAAGISATFAVNYTKSLFKWLISC